LLGRLKLERTLFVVTSKSGGTAETMAQYLVVRERLESEKMAAKDHIVFITDPQKGALRPLANAERIPALDIPENVGGRFSVLTPVGILPAALIGIDTAQLLAGAGDIVPHCLAPKLRDNPAGTFAALQFLADAKAGKRIHVLMPYSDALRDSGRSRPARAAEHDARTRGRGRVAYRRPHDVARDGDDLRGRPIRRQSAGSARGGAGKAVHVRDARAQGCGRRAEGVGEVAQA